MNNQIDTVKTFEQSVSIIEDQVSKIKFYEEKLSERKEFREYMRLKAELRILEEKTKPAIKEYMINHPEEFDTDDKGNLVAEGTAEYHQVLPMLLSNYLQNHHTVWQNKNN